MSTARGALRRRAFTAVVGRDLYAQRMLPAIGALLGILAPWTVFLPSLDGNDPAEVRDVIAMALAVLVLIGGFLGLGATTLTRDYRTGRMAFYLARPIHPSALWFGKLTALTVTSFSAFIATLLPTVLLGGRPWAPFLPDFSKSRTVRPDQLVQGWPWESRFSVRMVQEHVSLGWLGPIIVLLALLAAAHLLGVVFQLRNRWTVADFVVLGVLALVAAGAVTGARSLGAEITLQRFALWAWVTLVLAFLVGGWAQIHYGGSDGVRAHGVQSLLLWGGAALVILPTAWNVAALHHLERQDLDTVVSFQAAPQPPWMTLDGVHSESGVDMRLLWNSETDQTFKMPLNGVVPRFSPDGRWMSFPECPEKGDICTIQVWDLHDPPMDHLLGASGKGEASGTGAPGLGASGFAIEVPDGWFRSRVRWGEDGVMAVQDGAGNFIRAYSFPGGRPGRSVQVPEGRRVVNFELIDARLRLFCRSRGENRSPLEVFEIDLAQPDSELEATRSLPARTHVIPGAPGFISRGEDERVRILGLEPGSDLVLSEEHSGSGMRRYLADGRLLLILRPPEHASETEDVGKDAPPTPEELTARTWYLLDGEGNEISRFNRPEDRIFGSEIRPGLILVGNFESFDGRFEGRPNQLEIFFGPVRNWRTEVLDVESGEVVQLVSGHLPVWCSWYYDACPSTPGAHGSDWLTGPDGRPHRLDPQTGVVTPIMKEEG